MITAHRSGQSVYYRLSDPKIVQACDMMRQVLLQRLDSMSDLVEDSRL